MYTTTWKRHTSIRRAGQVKVEHEEHLQHVDVSREKVSENEDARRTRLESPHEQVPPLLVEHGTQGRDFPCCGECSSIFLPKLPCYWVRFSNSFRRFPAVESTLLFLFV